MDDILASPQEAFGRLHGPSARLRGCNRPCLVGWRGSWARSTRLHCVERQFRPFHTVQARTGAFSCTQREGGRPSRPLHYFLSQLGLPPVGIIAGVPGCLPLLPQTRRLHSRLLRSPLSLVPTRLLHSSSLILTS